MVDCNHHWERRWIVVCILDLSVYFLAETHYLESILGCFDFGGETDQRFKGEYGVSVGSFGELHLVSSGGMGHEYVVAFALLGGWYEFV